MHRHDAEGVAFAKRQCSEVGLAKARRIRQNGVEKMD